MTKTLTRPVLVVCTCGNKFTTTYMLSSTTLKVDTCNKCHKAYTGVETKKTSNVIQKFNKKYNLPT